MENTGKQSLTEFARSSPLLRIILIGFLVLLLQMPISMIRGVIGERQMRRQEATEDITSKWGKQQIIVGPLLTVPYLVRISETGKDGSVITHTETRCANFLPEDLHSSGKIDCEIRYRGIFKVPIYRMTLSVKGRFPQPDFSDWGIDAGDILWDRAHLTVRVSDAHGISNRALLIWNGREIGFQPGAGEFGGQNAGIHVSLKSCLNADIYPFSYQLMLNGSQGTFFVPFGQDTTVEIDSNWSTPSFQGNWLPSQRTVNTDGFQATWNIPFLGRNYPQRWRTGSGVEDAISASVFGVHFVTPVDHYRMAERSVKYQILFLVLTFVALWLFEILIHVRIQSIPYLFVGAGMCLFYLLELSLAEHIGFVVAYVCASVAVVALVTAYCVAVLKGVKHAAIIGTVISLLYGYLYILLMNQDYALLIGSLGLFVILATVMYLTRKIDWYSFKGS